MKQRTTSQIAASRANGAKSRGPVTPKGKLNSRRNSLRHGMLARTILLEGESRDRFNTLINSLCEELLPATPIELLLVEKMAAAQWRQMRVWGMEKASISHEASQRDPLEPLIDHPTRDALAFRSLGDRSRANGLMNQHEMRYDGQFSRALDRLLKLRSSRKSISDETNLGSR